MIIGLEGFGSVWSRVRDMVATVCLLQHDRHRLRTVRLRHRSRVFGQLRFNEIGGFNPKHIERNIGRVFEASRALWTRQVRCILLHHLLSRPVSPDYYLFAVTSDRTGELQIDREGWKSDSVVLVSLSQVGSNRRRCCSCRFTVGSEDASGFSSLSLARSIRGARFCN